MSDSDFGARLKAAREKSGLTQREAIEKAGIAKEQTLSAYERGVNSPPIETLKKLSQIYTVSTDYLLFGEEAVYRKTNTDKDYLVQLVHAADELDLSLIKKQSDMPWEDNYAISLSKHVTCQGHINGHEWDISDFNQFLQNWDQLRKARESGAITFQDYAYLIEKRISLIPDDLTFISSELPF